VVRKEGYTPLPLLPTERCNRGNAGAASTWHNAPRLGAIW